MMHSQSARSALLGAKWYRDDHEIGVWKLPSAMSPTMI